MRHEEKEVTSVGELITKLDGQRIKGEILWFRGHDSIEWELKPSITRGGTADPTSREYQLLKLFRQHATRLIEPLPTDDWLWLFLMQHYGVPTRLLDWSESPLVALFFAVQDLALSEKDGALWMLSPQKLNEAANLSEETLKNGIPFFGMDEDLDPYLPKSVAQAGAQSPQRPVAAIAARNSARIAAQLGVFTIFHSDYTALDAIGDGLHLWRYRIPAASKPKIRAELEVLQMNQFALFPELDKAGAHVKGGPV